MSIVNVNIPTPLAIFLAGIQFATAILEYRTRIFDAMSPEKKRRQADNVADRENWWVDNFETQLGDVFDGDLAAEASRELKEFVKSSSDTP